MLSRRTMLQGLGGGGAMLTAACAGPGSAPSEAPVASRGPVTLTFLSWRPRPWTSSPPSGGVRQEEQHHHRGGQDGRLRAAEADHHVRQRQRARTCSIQSSSPCPGCTTADSCSRLDATSRGTRSPSRGTGPCWASSAGARRPTACPTGSEPFAVYYNKTLFKQRGIDDPWERARNQGDWTLEEMVEAARKINDPANDVWGLDWGPHEIAYGIGPPDLDAGRLPPPVRPQRGVHAAAAGGDAGASTGPSTG